MAVANSIVNYTHIIKKMVVGRIAHTMLHNKSVLMKNKGNRMVA
jgi:hypothetical protein